jgi:hypothetical protein
LDRTALRIARFGWGLLDFGAVTVTVGSVCPETS